jgi:hypothetical protein
MDKNLNHWELKEGEDFSKTSLKNQKKCLKTEEGKQICMKLFVRTLQQVLHKSTQEFSK